MCDDNFVGNDNIRRTRLDDLVSVTIDDLVVRAEKDIEGDEEPIEACVALVELAAAAMADVVPSYEAANPELVMKMFSGRMAPCSWLKLNIQICWSRIRTLLWWSPSRESHLNSPSGPELRSALPPRLFSISLRAELDGSERASRFGPQRCRHSIQS
jgi:hypothetical protein